MTCIMTSVNEHDFRGPEYIFYMQDMSHFLDTARTDFIAAQYLSGLLAM